MTILAGRDDYPATYFQRREQSPTFVAEQKAMLDAMHVRPGERLLELGCGTGALLAHLSTSGARVVGLDLSPLALDIARQRRTDAMLVLGDASALPYQCERFDLVAAQHLIEHFADTALVLSEWRRVLRRGGRLAMVTPNADCPLRTWFDDPTHQRLFTADALRAALADAGFVVESVGYVNPFLGHARTVFPAARWLQGLVHVPVVRTRCVTLLATARRAD